MTPPRLRALRYLQPLREGGSLPGVVETDDGLFVAKFRGAGQGPRALIAELIAAGIARRLGLPVPDPAVIEVPSGFGADESDPEVRELLERSVGVNIGLRYLDGAFNYDARAAAEFVDAAFASLVVWLDAFVTNPDRTARNPNLLVWRRSPWLIDHGSALYAHHAWHTVDDARTRGAFPMTREHVLLDAAAGIEAADTAAVARLDSRSLEEILDGVPDELLMDPLARDDFGDADAARGRYLAYLTRRLDSPRAFVEEGVRAREIRRASPRQRLETRR